MANFTEKYVFELVDKVSKNLGNINKKLDGVDKNFTKVGKATSDAEKKIERATDSVKRLAIGFASFHVVKGVVGTLAAYGKTMSEVQAITGASSKEMEAFRKQTQELGATTEFTASQVGQAQKFFGMAGFSSDSVLEALPAALDLATASGMDLATTADIASNVLTGFGKEAKELGNVADVMSMTMASANTNIRQLGDAMKYVAPVAAGANISIERTAAAIGVLSDAGIQGEMAGTSLRGIISKLARPTNEAQKVLKKYGLTLEDVNPQTNDFADIIKKLAPLSKNTADTFAVFEQRAGPALSVLAENIGKVEKLTKNLENSEGALKKMADTMRDNLQGDLDTMKSALESITIKMGDNGLNGALRNVTKTLTVFFRVVAMVSPEIMVLLTSFTGFYILTKVAVMVGVLKKGLIALRLAAMANPFTALIVAAYAAYEMLKVLEQKLHDVLGLDDPIEVKVSQNVDELLANRQKAIDAGANLEEISREQLVARLEAQKLNVNNGVVTSSREVNSREQLKNKLEIDFKNMPNGVDARLDSKGDVDIGINANL